MDLQQQLIETRARGYSADQIAGALGIDETFVHEWLQGRMIFKSFTNDKGRVFNVRVLFDGHRYGRNNVLTWGQSEHYEGVPGVEFWDATYAHEALGQFTGARYFAETICFEEKWTPEDGFHNTGALQTSGLCLDGGNAESWSLDAGTMREVRLWILAMIAAREYLELIYSNEKEAES